MTVPLSRRGVLVRTNYTNIWFLVLNQLVLIYLYIYLCCLQLNRIGSIVYGSRIGANKILNETLLFTLFLSKKTLPFVTNGLIQLAFFKCNWNEKKLFIYMN